MNVKWKGSRSKKKLFPGWSFPMRGAKRGLEAGLTGNKAWSFPLFDCKRKKSKCRLLLRGRSHNQLTVQGKPKSPTNSGDISVQVRWTRSSWLNYALRDDEAVYWVSIGHYEAVAVGNWWYWVSRGHLCLYILHKVEIWTGATDALRTDSLTDWPCPLLNSKHHENFRFWGPFPKL